MGAGQFFAGLVDGYAGMTAQNMKRQRDEEHDRRQMRLEILKTALPHIQDPSLQAEALSLADELATGKTKGKGGLSEMFGPLIGKMQPRDEGHEAKLKEFLTRPRETVVAPSGEIPGQAINLPAREKQYYLPPIPGVADQGGTATFSGGAPEQVELAPIPVAAQTGTVRGPMATPAEQIQRSLMAKKAELDFEAPYQREAAARKFGYDTQLRLLDHEGRLMLAQVQERARLSGQQHDTTVHKEGGAPWEYVRRRVNGLGNVVSETAVDAPAAIQRDFLTAQATKRPGETIEQAYTRVLQLDQKRKEQMVSNLKGSAAERAQRMHLRAKNEELKNALAAGEIKTPQQARLALDQLSKELSQIRDNARRNMVDEPLAQLAQADALSQLAEQRGITRDQLKSLQALSLGKALAPVPGTGGGNPQTRTYQGYEYTMQNGQWVRGRKVE